MDYCPERCTWRCNIEGAIVSKADQPRHIEMSSVSYQASNADLEAEVRAHLEEHSHLESFYVSPTSKGKRMKMAAFSQDEADAKSTCSLDSKRLDMLGGDKLTVALLRSAKVKVLMAVYVVWKSMLDEESNNSKARHPVIRAYPDSLRRFMVLKAAGGDTKEIANARKRLDNVLSGTVLTDTQHNVRDPALSS